METQMTSRNRNEKWRVLIVDDEEAARYGIRRALAGGGDYEIEEAGSVEEARAALAAHSHDLMLLDVNLPGMSGLEYLRELSESEEERLPLVVMVTAYGSERKAVEAIKTGAYDYLSKPFEIDDLRLVVKNALETVRLRRENQTLRKRIELEGQQRGAFLGISEAMQRVRALVEKVAETDATVLVRGESGTGKELVARELHERSSHRRRGAFVAVNCAALPSELIESELFGHEKGAFTGAAARRRGKFEQADGGTLFLDEIGDMSTGVQAKLLRALEERRVERLGGSESIPVDVRIVSATHRPLEQEIEGGELTAKDLPEEIAADARAQKETASAPAADAGALSVPFTSDFREDRREFERRYIARCLEESGGNVTRAAAVLGMHRQSLQHKLRELGLARRYVAVGGDEAQDNPDT